MGNNVNTIKDFFGRNNVKFNEKNFSFQIVNTDSDYFLECKSLIYDKAYNHYILRINPNRAIKFNIHNVLKVYNETKKSNSYIVKFNMNNLFELEYRNDDKLNVNFKKNNLFEIANKQLEHLRSFRLGHNALLK